MSDGLYIKVEPCNITFISRIMEGYEYFGVVTTIDRSEGLLVIRTTPDMRPEIQAILMSLPIQVDFV
ncbi:DUF4911 domain-containing protein [Anaerospora hongkongensis]|uniref:DUF4911 domain-containing protein n=1 Tax=Anaerospora hongkongensis TaxID=244830 RepID=UPI002FD94560